MSLEPVDYKWGAEAMDAAMAAHMDAHIDAQPTRRLAVVRRVRGMLSAATLASLTGVCCFICQEKGR